MSRMGHLGEGAKEEAARRNVWSAQELSCRRQEEAFHSAYRGKALAHPGHLAPENKKKSGAGAETLLLS